MALLSFPSNPVDGQLYPVNPLPGQNQYQWEDANLTWRLLGAPTGVIAGTYGNSNFVGQFTVGGDGRITFAQNIPIAGSAGGTVTSITAGTGILANGVTGASITSAGTLALDTTYTNSLYLPLAGGTMTGLITFDPLQTFPGATVSDATTTSKGVVQIGTNIQVAAGVISVNPGTTTQVGVVQLEDSVASTSTTTAATPNSVKQSYDLANAALPRSGGTLTGPVRFDGTLLDGLGSAGTSGFVLQSNGTGIRWVAAPTKVSSVTGTLPIVVNDTNPENPVVSINSASTLQAGAVQLTD